MMVKKIDYSAWIGCLKTVKNSAYMLIPFAVQILAEVPMKYAWIASAIIYFLKNMYETKSGKKLK